MAGECAFFNENYEQVMEELHKINFFKSASLKDLSLTRKELLNGCYTPWKEEQIDITTYSLEPEEEETVSGNITLSDNEIDYIFNDAREE